MKNIIFEIKFWFYKKGINLFRKSKNGVVYSKQSLKNIKELQEWLPEKMIEESEKCQTQ